MILDRSLKVMVLFQRRILFKTVHLSYYRIQIIYLLNLQYNVPLTREPLVSLYFYVSGCVRQTKLAASHLLRLESMLRIISLFRVVSYRVVADVSPVDTAVRTVTLDDLGTTIRQAIVRYLHEVSGRLENN